MSELTRRRRALMGKQGGDWKSDYVQDGIIMWLDGEHNSIDGTHDPNLATWVDQSGNGYDWDLGGNFVIGEKSVNVSGSGGGSLVSGKEKPTSAFAEIVFRKTGSASGYEFIYGTFTGNNVTTKPNTMYLKGTNICFTARNHGPKTSLALATLGDVAYYNSELYRNGEIANNTEQDDNWTSKGNWLFRYNSQYGFKADVYAFRLYNRVLTESEILRNFAADQKRFGIEVSA